MTEDKKTLFIEGKEVEFTNEPNLLEVIRKAGMNVPTFCYRPDLTSFGACRMCVVEVEYPNGRTMINSSCTMPPEAGIKVSLNTAILVYRLSLFTSFSGVILFIKPKLAELL